MPQIHHFVASAHCLTHFFFFQGKHINIFQNGELVKSIVVQIIPFFFLCSFSLIGKRPWENASKDGREMLCVKSEPDWNSQHHKYMGTVCALSATLCSHHSKTFSLRFVLVSHFLWTRRFLWDISHKVCVLRRSFLHCQSSDTDRQLS